MAGELPVVFACSGCSNAGHLSYQVAQLLDRLGTAEMSCLAGVAARKPQFLKIVSGREVWVVDGCSHACGAAVLREITQGIIRAINLHELGVKKDAALPESCELGAFIREIVDHANLLGQISASPNPAQPNQELC